MGHFSQRELEKVGAGVRVMHWQKLIGRKRGIERQRQRELSLKSDFLD